MTEKVPGTLISNKTYDVLNDVVKLVLPGLGTLYFTIASIWGLPYAEQVVGTLAAFAVFFGIVLLVAKNKYESAVDELKKDEYTSDL